MIDRRTLIATAAVLPTTVRAQKALRSPIAGGRPSPEARAFSSPAIEQVIERVGRTLGTTGTRGKIADMFANAFPNTLDTTVQTGTRENRPDTFVVTGDIHAMWLRDSTAQVWPYLAFAKQDQRLARLLAGVVHRQTASVLLDPYANAFNRDLTPSADFADDETEMRAGVHERKWELDSLCAAIRLADGYWRATGDTAPFDADWRRASRLMVDTMRVQQRKQGRGPYYLRRRTTWSPDQVPGHGWGNPIRPVGLIVSMFRPSDDAALYPFLVPSNMFAVVMLRRLAVMHERIAVDTTFAAECRALADEVEQALRTHALVRHPTRGPIWAYEVDGYGNALFLDDANVPNLLSLPYLGWCAPGDGTYRRTRAFVLSEDNPWFHRGRAAEGLGSPHTPEDRIWPIGLTMRALTSTDSSEIAEQLRLLASTDAGTGFMHEAFNKNDAATFTRPWFAWANSLFGELVLRVVTEQPVILSRL